MKIVKYPDKGLRKRSEEIDPKQIPEYQGLIDEMRQIMYDSEGVGLAAPQLGINKRIIVIDPSPVDESVGFMAIINPEIIELTKETDEMEEGCLSLPGIIAPVKRVTHILVSGYDENGRPLKREFYGFPARVVLHETDHLNGILFIDRIDYASKMRIKPLLKQLEREYRNGKK